MAKEQSNYKDTVFRMIFKDKENLLSLYNGVNGTDYKDPEKMEITTLENALYMNMKNDISCVMDFSLNLYEHQSTVNPNIPLRDLFYVSKILQGLIVKEDVYSSRRINIPIPRFYMFYNGLKEMPLKEAIDRAITECIREGILSDFLRKNRAEALEMSWYEYNEELHLKNERQIAYEEGLEQGLENGIKQTILRMHKNGYLLNQIAEVVDKSQAEVKAVIEKEESVLI
ncbi:MAG: hypothetical protein K2P76_03000 [Lachnospiraceae bacterium]|nr:hypothetical protein [Lachnospiraceae bacterium]MDE6982690.1 hypothetical protein [Lachnospiraceae bacterium]